MQHHHEPRQGVCKKFNRTGASVIEYIVLSMLIIGALYVMKETISRGIFSKFKSSGDSFAFGRQYDAKRSSVCKTDLTNHGGEISYDEECYNKNVMRKAKNLSTTPDGCSWSSSGGCPQCYPGDDCCFKCEDAIKNTCRMQCAQDGGWSEWGACSGTCGGGAGTQVRACNNPPPTAGGTGCVGSTIRACVSTGCPIPGECGAVNNSCVKGSLKDLPDVEGGYRWNCEGLNGGSTATCAAIAPINGRCGTAFRDNCLRGTPLRRADVKISGLWYHQWNCNGANGGTNQLDCTIPV